MSQKHHAHPTAHGRKVLPLHAKPSRPAPLKRGNSHHHAHSQDHSGASSKLGPGCSRKVGTTEVVQQDEEEEDMASFLQFCATCERQIITPGVSILYCSEACRRKDVSKPTASQPPLSPSALSSTPSYFETPTPDIVPQRSPTIMRPVSLTFSDLSIEDSNSSGDDHEAHFYYRRPLSMPWTTADSSALPSLIHSPCSSVVSMASISSSRPLPSRRNKSYSSQAPASVDLVTPYPIVAPSSPKQSMRDASLKSSTSTLTSFRVAEAGNLSYDTHSRDRRESGAQGSLQQLFSHNAMKAPPTDASNVAPNAWSGS